METAEPDKGKVAKVRPKKFTLMIPEEVLVKLDEISKKKYRDVDRTKAIKWIIEDVWEDMQNDRKKVKGIA